MAKLTHSSDGINPVHETPPSEDSPSLRSWEHWHGLDARLSVGTLIALFEAGAKPFQEAEPTILDVDVDTMSYTAAQAFARHHTPPQPYTSPRTGTQSRLPNRVLSAWRVVRFSPLGAKYFLS